MREQRKKKWLFTLCMLFLSAVLIIIYRMDSGKKNRSYETGQSDTAYSFAMGTSVSVTLFGADAGAYTDLESEVKRLDTEVVSWREEGSALYKLNHIYAAGETYMPEDELYTALRQAYRVCEDSDGALDITLRPLASLWNIESETDDTAFCVPEEQAIRDALAGTGYEKLVFDDASRTVTIEKSDMILDLGAVGKGFALDVLQQKLKENTISGAIISVGGSILVYGTKDNGEDFRVGIRNPKGAQDEMTGYLTFPSGSRMCISTSGDYEKYKEKDGRRYHHILDRETGYPADSGLSSVTVVCGSGLYSDALSTACFVLGIEKSLPLLEKYDAEAVFIDQDNHITVTQGLQEQFEEIKQE